jgi:hypothetical protein
MIPTFVSAHPLRTLSLPSDIGHLLCSAGLITGDQLDAVLVAQASNGGTIPELLVFSGFIDDEELAEFCRQRLRIRRVHPNSLVRLSPDLTALLPEDVVAEFRVLPVALDKEGNLNLVMSDPTDNHAVDEIRFFTGAYVIRSVATQMQIAWALGHYYGLITPLGERLLTPETKADADLKDQPQRAKGLTDKVAAMRRKGIGPESDVHGVVGDDSAQSVAPAELPPQDASRKRMAAHGELSTTKAVPGGTDPAHPESTIIVASDEQDSEPPPILLERKSKRQSAQPTPSDAEGVVLLERRKGTSPPRAKRITEIGLGRLSTRPPGVDNSVPIPEQVQPSDTQPVYISSDSSSGST